MADKAKCCLLVLCGIPASGKSTLARALAAIAQAHGIATSIIEFDDHMPMEPPPLSQSEDQHAFDPEKWKAARSSALDLLYQSLQLLDTCYRLVIVDDTMHYRSMRGECWKVARGAHAAYLQLHLACPLPTALERNEARPLERRVPRDVLLRTAHVFEPPEESPCPWDKSETTIVIQESGQSDGYFDAGKGIRLDFEEIWAWIWDKWGSSAPEILDKEAEEERIAVARQATTDDVVHRVDVTTRKMLTATLSQLGNSTNTDGGLKNKAEIAKELNAHRRNILDKLRGKAAAGEDNFNSSLEEAALAAEATFSQRCDEVLANYIIVSSNSSLEI